MRTEESASKDRIEAAAREEFAAYGYHGARIDRIAAKSGLNKQLIYYYFGSKQRLHEHMVELGVARVQLEASLKRSLPGSPSDRLRALLGAVLDRLRSAPDLPRSAALGEGGAPGATEAARALVDLGADVGREISRGQGLGYYRDDADPAILGQQAISLLVGWTILRGMKDGATGPEADAWAGAAAGLLTRSLSW